MLWVTCFELCNAVTNSLHCPLSSSQAREWVKYGRVPLGATTVCLVRSNYELVHMQLGLKGRKLVFGNIPLSLTSHATSEVP